MEKNNRGSSSTAMLFLILLIFLAQKASTQGTNDWVRIDCGSPTSYPSDSYLTWDTDDSYIKTGVNKQVVNRNLDWEQLNTLRVFTDQNKNCYTLPTVSTYRHFIRATFYYGNYDGLSKPPSFGLELDGNKWDTVVTDLNNFVYYETIYAPKGDNTSVCLARTSDTQFPFISVLEALPVGSDMYDGLSRDVAWLKSYRYNYGATDWILGYKEDDYNRIWEPVRPSGLNPVKANNSYVSSQCTDSPPDLVMLDTVEALEPNDAIILNFTFDQKYRTDHVMVYMTEITSDDGETRSFDFYVNDELISTITPGYEHCTEEWTSTKSVDTLVVELRPTADSTLPPTISAIEVYTASDPLVTTTTSKDDLDGLAAFIGAFHQLEGWSGEPCLPSDTVWQWLTCSSSDPPRVTSLKLSGYKLYGPIPDFSQMEALETIDLSHNSLHGSIPAFLGNLPNLTHLDLSYNDLSGKIPPSLANNKKVKLETKGNQGLPQPKGKNLGLIIGLCVGLPIAVAVIAAALLYLNYLHQRKLAALNQAQATAAQDQGQAPPQEQGKPRDDIESPYHEPPEEGNVAANSKPAHQGQPVARNLHGQAGNPQDENARGPSQGRHARNSTPVQDLDEEDRDDLLRQFAAGMRR